MADASDWGKSSEVIKHTCTECGNDDEIEVTAEFEIEGNITSIKS